MRRSLLREHAATLLADRRHKLAANEYVKLLAGDDLKSAPEDLAGLWKSLAGIHVGLNTEARLKAFRARLAKTTLPPDVRGLAEIFVVQAYFLEGTEEGYQKSLREIDRIAPGIEAPHLRDQLQLLKASNLIKIGESDRALAVLSEVREKGSDDEERAKAGFLLGWLRLLDEQRDEARECLADTHKRWPNAVFGQKAETVLKNMDR